MTFNMTGYRRGQIVAEGQGKQTELQEISV